MKITEELAYFTKKERGKEGRGGGNEGTNRETGKTSESENKLEYSSHHDFLGHTKWCDDTALNK